jgi:ABC-2 type transport system ATP-binding protein
MVTVQAENLIRSFPGLDRPALDLPTLRFEAGQITGVVGPDGAGKTTLIRLLAGLLEADGGTLEVLGEAMPEASDTIQSRIGYMPQKFGLYEDLSVLENLTLYADLQGIPMANRSARIDELLRFTSLTDFTTRLAGNLSGGMKQKLGLACALIKKPTLLLLDEPGVGVDPISRKELWAMVHALLDEGVGVVWSTAYLEEAEQCDHILLLNEGTPLFHGHPQRLTETITGRTFLCESPGHSKRELLHTLLEHDEVMDGTIAGEHVRIMCRSGKTAPGATALGLEHIAYTPTPPRFEDAFIDRLGIKTRGHSPLITQAATVPPFEGSTIEARDLTKRFGTFTAAKNIDFAVKRGEVFGFLGPNGAGKSTTFRMLCGLLKASGGTAKVHGIDLGTAPAAARAKIGYMAQKFSLYGNLSVRDNLEFFAGIYGLKGEAKRRKIGEMVAMFELSPHLEHPADTLPLGFKQRLALSCSLMHGPSVLFLDEPTSGVDPLTRREFWTHINALVQKGVSIMVTTHLMDEAEYCDRLMLIFRGEPIAVGTPDDLKRQAGDGMEMEEAFIELIRRFERKEPA